MIELIIYGTVFCFIAMVLGVYVYKLKRENQKTQQRISTAKEEGTHEPISLYPMVDTNRCIKSGACITACPEHDVLGIRNGHATIVNATKCIGHGACLKSCPMGAISLWIGTEKRGVDIPEISPTFETNVPGIYIAGELGGMGLIRNAVTQGREAVENIAKSINKQLVADFDLIVVGAGPAGISATLTAKKEQLSVLTLEQDTLGGTVSTFPRSKIVMTNPMELPLYGKVKLKETSKTELLNLWKDVIEKNQITIKENSKVEEITKQENIFVVKTVHGDTYTCKSVLLTIGRRGTPRKLNIPGEVCEKVAYRLLEPEDIKGKKVLVVGGGDSAIESALLLCENNEVTISYRGSSFGRLKQRNNDAIQSAITNHLIDVKFNTNLTEIEPNKVLYKNDTEEQILELENDLVYIFAGGELPTEFLKKIGINIQTKRGEMLLKSQ